MHSWKQAFSAAKLELKASALHFLFAFVFILFFIFILVKSFDSYMTDGFAGFDFIFILLFTFAPAWMMPKFFQVQIIGNVLASPVMVMQNQLPITREVLVKSRLIIHCFYALPSQFLTLIALYVLTPMQNTVSAGAFTAFALSWIAFGIYAGFAIPYSEAGAGGKAPRNSDVLTVAAGIFLLIAALFVLAFFHVLFGNGVIYWSMMLAQKWPIPISIISIALAIAGYYYWKNHMKKALRETDYL
jgi:hypothetical protein